MRSLECVWAIAACSFLLSGCVMQGSNPSAGAPQSNASPGLTAAQLPTSERVRDALIGCGGGMRSGGYGELNAAWDKHNTNGKITAEAWRAIEAAFLKYVPAGDQKEAGADFRRCVEKLAGDAVEPGAIPKPAA